MNEFNFTNARLQKIINATGKDEEYGDTGQQGLILRLTKSNSKIFRLKVWNKQKREMVQRVIGHYPKMAINAAREIVARDVLDIANGIDITERTRQIREEKTFEEVFRIWLDDFAKETRKKIWEEDERRYNLYIAEHLGSMRISAITPDILRTWRRKLTERDTRRKGKLSKPTINRAFAIVRAVFNCCAPHLQNPCSQVPKFQEKKRDTFLKSDELASFFKALDHPDTPDYMRDYLLLSLYTGARRSNVLAMRWEHIDLNMKIWLLPGDEMKNTEPMVVPLLDQARVILEERKKTTSSAFVFPSPKSATGHLVEPKKAWKGLLARAGLPPTYWLHDLRRTMGSWQAITGTSTKIIGASLGHKSEAATAHYAHLIIEPVRAAMQRAADAMDGNQKTPAACRSISAGNFTVTIPEQRFSISVSIDENLVEVIQKELVRRLIDDEMEIVIDRN